MTHYQTTRLDQYLSGELTHPDDATTEKIWLDAIRSDWQGDFNVLPECRLSPWRYKKIVSRPMYDRLKEYFGYNDPERSQTHRVYCFENAYYKDLSFTLIRDLRYKTDLAIRDIFVVAMEQMWLDELQQFLVYPVALAHAAILFGHLKLLKYLVAQHGVDLPRLNLMYCSCAYGYAMDIVASGGYLEMLKYLHEAGFECSREAKIGATKNGHTDVVKFLRIRYFVRMNYHLTRGFDSFLQCFGNARCLPKR